MRHGRGTAMVALMSVLGCASAGTVERVKPEWVHAQLAGATPPAFACAYEAKECQGTHPEGAVTLEALRESASAMPKDQVIVFCCG